MPGGRTERRATDPRRVQSGVTSPIPRETIEVRPSRIQPYVRPKLSTASDTVLSLSPRVILMDLHLRGIGDGVDAAKQIHEAYGLKYPVIFLTGDTSSDAVHNRLVTRSDFVKVKNYGQTLRLDRQLHLKAIGP